MKSAALLVQRHAVRINWNEEKGWFIYKMQNFHFQEKTKLKYAYIFDD